MIEANWLIGEAAEEELSVSDAAVERALKQRRESPSGGTSEFEKELDSTGRTTDDVKLEIKAELAAQALHHLVETRVPVGASQQEITDYYHHNIARFRAPERRRVRGRILGRTKGLEEVGGEIEAHIVAGRRRQLFAEFAKGLRDKWIEKTDCSPGFVVQKCSQYRGLLEPEEDPLSRA